MKKLLTLIAFVLVTFTVDAQSYCYDTNSDGEIDINDVMCLVNHILGVPHPGEGGEEPPQSYLTCPDDNHPHLIDLGLPSGTKWACCNVGANKPEEYGGYYAWGEVQEKGVYNWDTYQHCNSSDDCLFLGDDIAGTQYDVARVKWGNDWQMPTYDQMVELLNNTTFTWTSKNGVEGGLFTGSNGGTIFLPAAGDHWYEQDFDNAGWCGAYWLSTQDPWYSNQADGFGFGSFDQLWGYCTDRYVGQSVRPVWVP